MVARSDDVVLAVLWRLRRKISTRGEFLIPPEWIFTNAELELIAHGRPTDMEALRRLPGIDPRRREVSGLEFVSAVAQVEPPPPRPAEPSSRTSDRKPRPAVRKPSKKKPAAKKTAPDPPRRRPKRGTSSTGGGGSNLFNTYGQQDYRPGGGGRYDG